eukprot:jgi/Botrbrau1/13108/Bobra.0187s0065.1
MLAKRLARPIFVNEMDAGSVVDVARAYAKFGFPHVALFDALAARALTLLDSYDSDSMLRLLSSFAALDLHPQDLLSAVELWAERRIATLPADSLAAAIWSLARLGRPSEKVLAAVAAAAEGSREKFTPLQLSLVAWGLARLEVTSPAALKVYQHLGEVLKTGVAAFAPKALANSLWALAKVEKPSGIAPILRAVAPNLEGRCRTFNAQCLSNILWVYGRFCFRNDALLKALTSACQYQIRGFEPQGLSNVVWALGTLEYMPEEYVLREICSAAVRLKTSLDTQHLGNLAWGFAKLSWKPPPEFVAALFQEARARVRDLRTQELFLLIWATCRWNCRGADKGFGRAALPEVMDRLAEFKPSELSGIVWALTRMKYSPQDMQPLLLATAAEAAHPEDSWEIRALVQLVWCLGKYQVEVPEELLERLLQRVQAKLPHALPKDIAMLLSGLERLAYLPLQLVSEALQSVVFNIAEYQLFEVHSILVATATLGLREEALLEAVAREPRLCAAPTQLVPILRLFWALTVLEAYEHPMFEAVTDALSIALEGYYDQELALATADALLVSHKALEGSGLAPWAWRFGVRTQEESLLLPVPQKLLKKARSYCWKPAEKRTSIRLNTTEQEILAVIVDHMSLKVSQRWFLRRPSVTAHLMIHLRTGKVALEVMDERWLTRGDAIPTGESHMRRRLIMTTGNRVAMLFAADWEAQTTIDERVALLKSVLEPFQEGAFSPGFSTWGYRRQRYLQRTSQDSFDYDGDGGDESYDSDRPGPLMLPFDEEMRPDEAAPPPVPKQDSEAGRLRTSRLSSRWGITE